MKYGHEGVYRYKYRTMLYSNGKCTEFGQAVMNDNNTPAKMCMINIPMTWRKETIYSKNK